MPAKIAYPRECVHCASTYQTPNAFYHHNKTCAGYIQSKVSAGEQEKPQTNNMTVPTRTNVVTNNTDINVSTREELDEALRNLVALGRMDESQVPNIQHVFDTVMSVTSKND